MKKKLHLLLSLIILVSMVLTACTPDAPVVEEIAPEVVAEEPAVVEEPAVEEVAVEESVVEEVSLDESFGAMLETMVGYNTIKADALLVEMVEDTPPFILDVRSAAELEEQGHIAGAFHIPLDELAQHTDLLPSFDTPIVAYCGSSWRATIAMTALHGMGWTNVRTLKVKFVDWKEAGNPVTEGIPEAMALNVAEPAENLVAASDPVLVALKDKGWGGKKAEDLNLALVDNPDMILIDVRRTEELAEKGIIAVVDQELIAIPLESFIADMGMWPADKDAAIVVYCGSGHRSTMAMTILLTEGYSNVTSLKGGFGGWVTAGYATVGGVPILTDTYGAMLETMVGYNTIKADALLVEMVEDTPPFILDVRSAAELEESGHIEGAFHIPLDELAQHTDLLPSFDTPIVAYCGSSWRATIAMTALHGMGWTNVRTLKVKFVDWKEAGNPVTEGIPEAMALNVAEPAENLVAASDPVLVALKDKGWGGKKAEDLNLALVDNPDMLLIDVRRTEELAEKGVIAVVDQELIAIPLESFIADVGMWPADKDAEIVVYCGSGHRSTMAMTILLTEGYSNVTSLKGGFGGWVTAGFPVAEFVAP